MAVVPRALLLLVALVAPLSAYPGSAIGLGETVYATTALVPGGSIGADAVWTDEGVFIIGGHLGGLRTDGGYWLGDVTDRILRFDPADHTFQTLDATASVLHPAVVATEDAVYIIGGFEPYVAPSAAILRLDPATGDLEAVAPQLPVPLWGASAVWDGSKVYIFGGHTDGWTESAQILAFDPVAGTVEVLPVELPIGMAYGHAFWDGTTAHIVGGILASGDFTEIQRFTPGLDGGTVDVAPVSMPAAVTGKALVYDGERAWFLGGRESDAGDWIVVYDPALETVEQLATTLPYAVTAAAAAYDPVRDCGYVFAGQGAIWGLRPYGQEDPAAVLQLGTCDAPIATPVPVALVSWDLPDCIGDPLRADASASYSPRGLPLEFTWDWGDGSGASGAIAEHLYTSTGPATASVWVTEVGGNSSGAGILFDVPELECPIPVPPPVPVQDPGPNRPPVALPRVGIVDCSRQAVRLDGQGSFDMDGEIVSHRWLVEGAPELAGPVVEANVAAGARVTLVVQDDMGALAQATVPVAGCTKAAAVAPPPAAPLKPLVQAPSPVAPSTSAPSAPPPPPQASRDITTDPIDAAPSPESEAPAAAAGSFPLWAVVLAAVVLVAAALTVWLVRRGRRPA